MQLDKRPFGTQLAVYSDGFEWMLHSLGPGRRPGADFRIEIGGPDCRRPYSASVLNISAMSFGSLSANAIRALNGGAKLGGFAHDTGEGGFSPYHREMGGDIIWEIGSRLFRLPHAGRRVLRRKTSRRTAQNPQIKMIEIKLSQGAKPGHGGVLPAAKVTPEIAAIRGVPMGLDCVSPRRHSAFSTPLEMMAFIGSCANCRAASRSGSSSASASRWSSWPSCKAMLESGRRPISSSSTARRAAPAPRRWNSWTMSARRCARG